MAQSVVIKYGQLLNSEDIQKLQIKLLKQKNSETPRVCEYQISPKSRVKTTWSRYRNIQVELDWAEI